MKKLWGYFFIVLFVCHVVVMYMFISHSPKEKPYYIEVEREYTHCYPVMKFKDDFVIMYWETKCVKRKYITLEEE